VHDKAAEADLVAGFRRGEAAALRQIYAQFADRLFRFLVRLTGRVDVAEDLHQETWIAATRAASRLAVDTDLAAWLFTIARNKHRSHRRWQSVDQSRFESRAEPPPAAAAESHDPEARHDLERALAALPAIHREVLVLVGCEGLGQDQAAAVLGISPEATRQRLSRARAALAETIGAATKDDNVVDMRKGAR
jgi:RNA polymerase sigma-70 factor (ECF subfamily)